MSTRTKRKKDSGGHSEGTKKKAARGARARRVWSLDADASSRRSKKRSISNERDVKVITRPLPNLTNNEPLRKKNNVDDNDWQIGDGILCWSTLLHNDLLGVVCDIKDNWIYVYFLDKIAPPEWVTTVRDVTHYRRGVSPWHDKRDDEHDDGSDGSGEGDDDEEAEEKKPRVPVPTVWRPIPWRALINPLERIGRLMPPPTMSDDAIKDAKWSALNRIDDSKEVNELKLASGVTIKYYQRLSDRFMTPFHSFILNEAESFGVDNNTWTFLVLLGAYKNGTKYIGIDQYVWAALQFDLIGVLLLIDHIINKYNTTINNNSSSNSRNKSSDKKLNENLKLALSMKWTQFRFVRLEDKSPEPYVYRSQIKGNDRRCLIPTPKPLQFAIDQHAYTCANWLLNRTSGTNSGITVTTIHDISEVVDGDNDIDDDALFTIMCLSGYYNGSGQLAPQRITPLAHVLNASTVMMVGCKPQYGWSTNLESRAHTDDDVLAHFPLTPERRQLAMTMLRSGSCEVDEPNTKVSLSLLMAAAYGDTELIDLIAPRIKYINHIHRHSDTVMWTPLLLAIRSCSIDAVAALLKHGADPNMGVTPSAQPLHYAVQTRVALSMVRLLLSAGAQPSLDPSLLTFTMSTLFSSSRSASSSVVIMDDMIPLMELLIVYGADPHVTPPPPPLLSDQYSCASQPISLSVVMIALQYQ